MRVPIDRRAFRPAGVVALLILAASAGCLRTVQRNTIAPAAAVAQLDSAAPMLKAHLRGGDVVMFSRWQLDSVARTVSGEAMRYDMNRVQSASGPLRIPLDSVVLFESNRVLEGTSHALAIVTGASLAGSIACAANPKACFGSCPTIYVGNGAEAHLEAESFSSSVSPSLEATDVDALPSLRAEDGVLRIHVRNEALETHNIRSVALYALPRTRSDAVYADGSGTFWRARRVLGPLVCRGADGDCLAAFATSGGAERSVRVDTTDLATREVIDLRFPVTSAPSLGLVLRSRQSLVSTFLFYQTLSYLGRAAGQWFAALERGDSVAHRQARRASEALGAIEVQRPMPDGSWRTVAQVDEHGPLAADVRVLPLPPRAAGDTGAVRVRLRMAKGAWRLDHVALAELEGTVEPIELTPQRVYREQRAGRTLDPAALAALRDTTRLLTTLPGDGYGIEFTAPSNAEAMSYFVAVRGYYLEWMRQEWLAEENPLAAAALLADPARAMRTLAPKFAALEPTMEQAFWGSRHALR